MQKEKILGVAGRRTWFYLLGIRQFGFKGNNVLGEGKGIYLCEGFIVRVDREPLKAIRVVGARTKLAQGKGSGPGDT